MSSRESQRVVNYDIAKLPSEGTGSGTEGINAFPSGQQAPLPVINVNDGYFPKDEVEASYEDNWELPVDPVSLADPGRLTFIVPKTEGLLCLFLNRAEICWSVTLTDKDGNAPETNLSVAPVNNVSQALINTVTCYANGTRIMSTQPYAYAMNANFNALMNNGADRKNGLMEAAGYYEDYYSNMKNEWKDVQGGSGWEARRNLFGEYKMVTRPGKTVKERDFIYDKNKEAHFTGKLNTEFVGPLPMVSRVGATYEIALNPPGFYLQSDLEDQKKCIEKGYRFNINRVKMYIPVKMQNPGLGLDLEKKMLNTPAEFRNIRMDMGRFLLHQGTSTFNTDQLKSFSICPDRIAFFIVPAWQLEGSYGQSPFRSCPYIVEQPKEGETAKVSHLSKMVLTINNQAISHRSHGNYEELVHHAFVRLHKNLGLEHVSEGINIGYRDFYNGKFYALFDLTKSGNASTSGPIRQETKQGVTKLDLEFDVALPCNAYLFVAAEYHSSVKVTQSRTVYYSFID